MFNIYFHRAIFYPRSQLYLFTPGADIGKVENTKNSTTHIKTSHFLLKLSRLPEFLGLTSFSIMCSCGVNKNGEKRILGQIKTSQIDGKESQVTKIYHKKGRDLEERKKIT